MFVLYLAPLHAIVYVLGWVAAMDMAYKIAPADFVGTLVALVNVFQWTIGEKEIIRNLFFAQTEVHIFTSHGFKDTF